MFPSSAYDAHVKDVYLRGNKNSGFWTLFLHSASDCTGPACLQRRPWLRQDSRGSIASPTRTAAACERLRLRALAKPNGTNGGRCSLMYKVEFKLELVYLRYIWFLSILIDRNGTLRYLPPTCSSCALDILYGNLLLVPVSYTIKQRSCKVTGFLLFE